MLFYFRVLILGEKMNIVKNIPENIKGVIFMIAGFALLLHTLGVLSDLLWYILIIISLYLILTGFIKAKGVDAVKRMIAKRQEVVSSIEVHPENNNENKK